MGCIIRHESTENIYNYQHQARKQLDVFLSTVHKMINSVL